MDVDVPGPAQFAYDHRFHRSFFLAGFAILLYDYALTLRAETKYIWSSRLRVSTLWFYLVRYIGLFANVVVAVFYLAEMTHERCVQMQLVWEVLLVVLEVLVEVTLIIRVFAMYGLNFWILGFLLGTGSISAGLALWAIVTYGHAIVLSPPPGVPNLNGCHVAFPRQSAYRLAGAWEALLVCDALVFILTLRRAYIQRPASVGVLGRGRSSRRIAGDSTMRQWQRAPSLLDRMLRDGAMYFGVIFVANFANLLTFYLGDVLLAGSLSWFTTSISVTLLCRLMLRLHSAGHTNTLMSSNTDEDLEGDADAQGNAVALATLRFQVPNERRSAEDGDPEADGARVEERDCG